MQKDQTFTDLLGSKLLTTLQKSAEPTCDVLKGKDLVCLYFSASWCPPCKQFTPILSSFYTSHCKPSNIEIIYISSDSDLSSFENYYTKMPWCSLPFHTTTNDHAASRAIKQKLANIFHISGIPTLIVLDSKGNFVTDGGRNDVMRVGDSMTKGKELVQKWKEIQAVPLEEAQFSGGQGGGIVKSVIMTILRNPMYLVGMFYLIKRLIQRVKSLQRGGDDGGGGGGGEEF